MSKKPKSAKNRATDVESVKIKLGVKERIGFGNFVPEENDIITQTIARDILKKVSLGQAEMKKIGMKKSEDGGWRWKKEGPEITFVFTNAEIELLRQEVEKLDKQKKITLEMLPTCLKIRK